MLISASAPGTSGKAPASAPAVFAVTLNAGANTASVASFFADNASATAVNGSNTGKKVTLALTDPDSNLVVPSSSPKFAGDFMLNSQGDEELIFADASGKNLQVLKISNSVDDIAWATSASGTLYTTDSSANTVDAITGPFKPGTVYTAVTPCNANSAPSTCPAPGYPANSLGTIDLTTGAIGNITHRGDRTQGSDLRPVTSPAARYPGGAAGPACGWMTAASASTPLTSRGPGRTTMPSASMAQTGTPGSASATTQRLLGRAGQVVAARRDHHQLRLRRPDVGPASFPPRASPAGPPPAGRPPR